MTMISRDDLPETPDWQYVPDAVFESTQHQAWMSGAGRLWTLDEVIAELGIDERDSIADTELDGIGTE